LEKYKELALYFRTEYDEFHVATYFYNKSMILAEKLGDIVEVALGKMGYATCNDKLDRPDEAIYNLEQAMKLVSNDPQTMQLVSKELIEIYKKLAQKYETDVVTPNAQELALENYENCLEVCSRADDTATEGSIAHKIGQIYFKRGEYEKAIEHQKKYLEISTKKAADVRLENNKREAQRRMSWKPMLLWRSVT